MGRSIYYFFNLIFPYPTQHQEMQALILESPLSNEPEHLHGASLHSLNVGWCAFGLSTTWASFHVFVGHLYVFCREMSL